MSIKTCFNRGHALLGLAAALLLSTPNPSFAGGVYFVKPGDTLSRISRLFGVGVDQIVAENRLASPALQPGDKLRIPEGPRKAFVELSALAEPTAAAPSRNEAAAGDSPVAERHELAPDRMLQALCREETVYHTVVRGETLSAIATRYSTEIGSLLQLNGLKKRSRLSIGQKIVVRKSGPRSHAVARGETLADIAARYGFEAAELARLNHLDGESLTVGQRLLIQPCDPYATAGSAPPPLDGSTAADLDPLPARDATQGAADSRDPSFSAPTAAIAQRVINLARTMLNVPYRFGGSTLRGIDCSAYVQRVFGMMDVPLPRTAREQYSVGARVGRDDIQVGDLLFFRTYASFPSHVGIYLGENLFIHASSMVRKVSIDSIDLPYYRKRFIGARRLVVDGSPAVASTP
jgi:cell wall-associated NlpC family hydrolase